MRYIDADALIEDIKRIYCTDCNNYNEIRCRACGTDDALRMIEDAPEADVVPRAEVEAVKAEVIRAFADRLKRYYKNLGDTTLSAMVVYQIEQIEKEMIGDKI